MSFLASDQLFERNRCRPFAVLSGSLVCALHLRTSAEFAIPRSRGLCWASSARCRHCAVQDARGRPHLIRYRSDLQNYAKCKRGTHKPDDWLRGRDLNPRPSGYEPDELPGCSTPRFQNSFDVDFAQIEKPTERELFLFAFAVT